jgi:predicted transcriptional regulator
MTKAKKKADMQVPAASEDTTIKIPTFKAVALIRIPDAPSTEAYVSVILTIKGNEVIDVKSSEPNLKSIAIENAKIDFVKTFYDNDEN